MNDDQFTKLFKYMDKRFDIIEKRIEGLETRTDTRFDEIISIIDGYAEKIDSYALEMAAMDHKISRLEKYIQILADKAGIDLDAIHI